MKKGLSECQKPLDNAERVTSVSSVFSIKRLRRSEDRRGEGPVRGRWCPNRKEEVNELMFVTFSPSRHILGFPTDQLVRGPIIKKELEEQLSQQMSYFHLIHW